MWGGCGSAEGSGELPVGLPHSGILFSSSQPSLGERHLPLPWLAGWLGAWNQVSKAALRERGRGGLPCAPVTRKYLEPGASVRSR